MVKVPIKEATAASVLNTQLYSPSNLIDSDPSTMYASEDPQQPRKLIWVQLELSNTMFVSKIVVTNRVDGFGARFINANIRVGDQKVNNANSIEDQENLISKNKLCNSYKGPGKDGEVITIRCEKPIAGKFVIIQLMDTCDGCYLNIMEVEVYRNIANIGKYLTTFRRTKIVLISIILSQYNYFIIIYFCIVIII